MSLLRDWRAAARFTLGVLLIWGVVSLMSYAVHVYSQGDSSSSRLPAGQFCTVTDFMVPDFLAPTECHVFDRAYQLNPNLGAEQHLFVITVDIDTFLAVEYDKADPSIIKGKSGKRDVDGRWVKVHFISGALSGRQGFVARYKLAPRI
jgi:hypothetical protein